jgi:hypothetical protein
VALQVAALTRKGPGMTRSSLYTVIAILAALAVGFGLYIAYQETQKPSLEIKVDQGGIKIDGNG